MKIINQTKKYIIFTHVIIDENNFNQGKRKIYNKKKNKLIGNF